MKLTHSLQITLVCMFLLTGCSPNQADAARFGHMQADKILFLGNSITNTDRKSGYWGMSASTRDKDYVHVLSRKIDAATGGSLVLTNSTEAAWSPGDPLPDWDANVINIAAIFESNYNTWENARIQNQLDWNADIVVVQFGENLKNGTLPELEEALDTMLTGLKESSNPHIFVTSHIIGGGNTAVDAIKQRLCAKDPTHRVFVDLTDIWDDPDNIGDLSHPSDAGMAAIADTLFHAMETHAVPEPSSITLLSVALLSVLCYGWRKRRN